MVNTLVRLQLLDVVALKAPLPEHNLNAGQVGTLVEQLAPDVYEVEFSDDHGQTYAILPLRTEQVLKLVYLPPSRELNAPGESPMGNTIYQHGSGDNIAGDKVMRDKINTQINHSQDLTQAAKDIKTLLTQLENDYDPTKPVDKAMMTAKVVEAVDKNPTLKARVINALKEGGSTALEEAIAHPVVKPVVAALKGFIDV